MNRRIVLGSGDPMITERIRSAVPELGDEVVRVAATSGELLDLLTIADPDVLIVSDTLGPVPVLDLVRQATRQDPRVGILLLVSSEDPEFFRQAMEAGARSVVSVNFTVDDLGQRLETAGAWTELVRRHLADQARDRAMGSGHVVVLAGSKGGVGTSTLAVHMALHAVADARRVCLVDFDLLTGDIGALLDISHRRDVVDLVPVADEVNGQALEDSLYRHPSGLHVLLAPRDGERGEEVDEHVGRAVLGAVKSRFDVVIVDVGSHLTTAGAVAVQIADRAVVVLTPDVMSVRGARRSLQMWDRLQLRRPTDVGLVLNRVSRGAEVQPDLAERLMRQPLSPITVPAAFRALEAATNAGDPARVSDRDLRRALGRLAVWLGVRPDATAVPGQPAATAPMQTQHSDAPIPALQHPLTPAGGLTLPAAQQRSTVARHSGHPRDTAAAPADSGGIAVAAASGTPTAARDNGLFDPAHLDPTTPASSADDSLLTRRTSRISRGANGNGAGGSDDPDVATSQSRMTRRFGRRNDSGQTAIEFMGLIGLILVTIALLTQMAVIGYGNVLASNAASAGARVAVSPLASMGQISSAARDQLGTGWRRNLSVSMTGSRSVDPNAAVTVRFRVPAVIPAADSVLGDVMNVSSTAQMRFEGS